MHAATAAKFSALLTGSGKTDRAAPSVSPDDPYEATMQRLKNMWSLLLLGLLLAPAMHAQTLTVRHVDPVSEPDARHRYYIELLDLVLKKTDGPYRLVGVPTSMPQGRALALLEKGEMLDVVWTMTSTAREAALRPIRIPLFKGLFGTRLLLIRSADAERFRQIREVNVLRALATGQGHDWPDTAILEHNGFRVTSKATYEALFRMLCRGRIDFFPRSVIEIWEEADRYATDGLVVAPGPVLHYPTALYFFVHRDNTILAQRLEEGFRRARADGSFDRLFQAHFGALLARARLDARPRFDLLNPLLPAATPLARAALWYHY